MVSSVYANGNIGGQDLERIIESLNETIYEAKRRVLNPALAEKQDVSPEGFVTHEWWKVKKDGEDGSS